MGHDPKLAVAFTACRLMVIVVVIQFVVIVSGDVVFRCTMRTYRQLIAEESVIPSALPESLQVSFIFIFAHGFLLVIDAGHDLFVDRFQHSLGTIETAAGSVITNQTVLY